MDSTQARAGRPQCRPPGRAARVGAQADHSLDCTRGTGIPRSRPVKTAAGRRDLLLLPLAAEVLAIRAQAQEADRQVFGCRPVRLAWFFGGLR